MTDMTEMGYEFLQATETERLSLHSTTSICTVTEKFIVVFTDNERYILTLASVTGTNEIARFQVILRANIIRASVTTEKLRNKKSVGLQIS